MKAGTCSTNHFLRRMHNLALGFGWLPWPAIAQKLWPKYTPQTRRAITWEEHQRILAAEKNLERRSYYELLWEVGGAQTDAARLTAEDIDWTFRTISFHRCKTESLVTLSIGQRLEEILKELPQVGSLFPRISRSTENARSAEFRRRCKLLNIEGISLHSYRYSWAERAKQAGMPERFAMASLGHNSKAVARAYAKKAHMKIPALDEYEQLTKKLVPFSEALGT
jgi:integrase